MPAPTTYALVFKFPEVIVGRGFTARVELQGRALLVEESDGDTWIYGVQPGGLAAGSEDGYKQACHRFKGGWRSVLFDMANDTPSYEEFARHVQELFDTVNEPNATAWNDALAEVRKNPAALGGFTSVKAESLPPKLTVSKLDQGSMVPALNQSEQVAKAA